MDSTSVKDKLQLIGIISVGVFLGNILSKDQVLSIPSYLWSYYLNKYYLYHFENKYQRYLSDFSVDRLLNNNLGRNILILCHGRNYSVVHRDIINYEKDLVITVDSNRDVLPHFVSDLSKPKCCEPIPDNSIDLIIFHFCYCHTSLIESNPDICNESYRMLKESGQLWVGGSDNEEIAEWPQEKFELINRVTNNDQEMIPRIDIYSGFLMHKTWYFQVWVKKPEILEDYVPVVHDSDDIDI